MPLIKILFFNSICPKALDWKEVSISPKCFGQSSNSLRRSFLLRKWENPGCPMLVMCTNVKQLQGSTTGRITWEKVIYFSGLFPSSIKWGWYLTGLLRLKKKQKYKPLVKCCPSLKGLSKIFLGSGWSSPEIILPSSSSFELGGW